MGFITDLLSQVVNRESHAAIAEYSDPPTDNGYFPNGRVANNSMQLSPITGAGPFNRPADIPFQSGAYPYRDDGPQYSWDQGMGRSPGFQWPNWTIREQFSWDSLSNMSGIMEDGTADLPVDSNANPLVGKSERQGWALMGPAITGEFYQQDNSQHLWFPDPVPIAVPDSIPLTALAEVE